MSAPEKKPVDTEAKRSLPRLHITGDAQIQSLFAVLAYKFKSQRLSQQAQAAIQRQHQNTAISPNNDTDGPKPESRSIFSTKITKQQQKDNS